MIPLVLDLTGRRVVVVGGGPVGRRKAEFARRHGAAVVVIALEPAPADWPTDWLQQPYEPAHLAGAVLVFAAGPPAVNARVVADARRLGIWVNSASHPSEGDVQVPALLSQGRLQIAISTSGASPAFARRLRDRLQTALHPQYADFLEWLAQLREHLQHTMRDPHDRRAALEQASDWPWFDRFIRDGWATTWAAFLAESQLNPRSSESKD